VEICRRYGCGRLLFLLSLECKAKTASSVAFRQLVCH